MQLICAISYGYMLTKVGRVLKEWTAEAALVPCGLVITLQGRL